MAGGLPVVVTLLSPPYSFASEERNESPFAAKRGESLRKVKVSSSYFLKDSLLSFLLSGSSHFTLSKRQRNRKKEK